MPRLTAQGVDIVRAKTMQASSLPSLAPIAQWIEQFRPKEEIAVRVRLGVPKCCQVIIFGMSHKKLALLILIIMALTAAAKITGARGVWLANACRKTPA